MPTPTIYSFTVQDAKGVKATALTYVAYDAATETVGALLGNAAVFGGLVDAISGGVLIDGRVIIDIARDPGWKATPVAGSNVEQTGLFDFNQNNSKYVAAVDIPALLESTLVGGRIDLANTDIAAFITNLTQASGIGGSTTVFNNSKYLNATRSLRDALVTFRKHKRALDRVSFETP